MKNFKNWFYENIDDLYKHPSSKKEIKDLNMSRGLVMRCVSPPIEFIPEGLEQINPTHITLIKSDYLIPVKKRLTEILGQNEELHDLPKPIFGKQVVATRKDGKISLVAEVSNQDEFKNYVDKIWSMLGKPNPEDRYFHITLANNRRGDPYESIGDINKSDFEE